MTRKKPKKETTKRKPLALTRSDDLCKRLVAMAAFSLFDNPKSQEIVYAAVRQLQRLDAVAVEAGILPPPPR